MKRSIVTLPIVLGVIGALGFAAPPSFAATKKSEHGMAATKHAKKSTARVRTKKTAVAAAPAAPAAPAQTAIGSEMMKPPPKVKPIFPDTPPPPAR